MLWRGWRKSVPTDAASDRAAHPADGVDTVDIAWHPCYHVNMIVSFKDEGSEDVFNGKNTKAARKTCPASLWKIATRKLDQLDSVTALDELHIPPGNRLEALAGDRKGQHRIRINDQYRICFRWSEFGPERVEIVDYH